MKIFLSLFVILACRHFVDDCIHPLFAAHTGRTPTLSDLETSALLVCSTKTSTLSQDDDEGAAQLPPGLNVLQVRILPKKQLNPLETNLLEDQSNLAN